MPDSHLALHLAECMHTHILEVLKSVFAQVGKGFAVGMLHQAGAQQRPRTAPAVWT